MALVRLTRRTDGPVWRWLQQSAPATTPQLLLELARSDRGYVLATPAAVEDVTTFLTDQGFRFDGAGDWQMPVGTQPDRRSAR